MRKSNVQSLIKHLKNISTGVEMKEKDEPRSHMLSENLNFISDLWMLYILALYLK